MADSNMELDMVADMEVNKVADKLADMVADNKKKSASTLTWRIGDPIW